MIDALVLIALVIGLAIGTYYVARSPAFWVDMITHVVRGLVPVLTKRMPPEQEAAWRDCMKRGGRWDHQKKRCDKWR